MTLNEIFDFSSELLLSIVYFVEEFFEFVIFLFTSLPFTLLDFVKTLPTPLASGINLLIGVIVVVCVLKLIAIVKTK